MTGTDKGTLENPLWFHGSPLLSQLAVFSLRSIFNQAFLTRLSLSSEEILFRVQIRGRGLLTVFVSTKKIIAGSWGPLQRLCLSCRGQLSPCSTKLHFLLLPALKRTRMLRTFFPLQMSQLFVYMIFSRVYSSILCPEL